MKSPLWEDQLAIFHDGAGRVNDRQQIELGFVPKVTTT